MSPVPPSDLETARAVAELLRETQVGEIEIERDGARVRVAARAVASAPAPAPAPAPAAAPAEPPADNLLSHEGLVRSPMVGTAYRAPSPQAPPFVEEGGDVAQGETVLIVEAMKTMNPIVAPKAGRLRRFLVENGEPVDFNAPLFVVE